MSNRQNYLGEWFVEFIIFLILDVFGFSAPDWFVGVDKFPVPGSFLNLHKNIKKSRQNNISFSKATSMNM